MNNLLIEQPLNKNVMRGKFIEDVTCLFQNLKDLYGMYNYFGESKFEAAYDRVMVNMAEKEYFDFQLAVHT